MSERRLSVVAVGLTLLLIGSACSGDPERERQRYYESGRAYLAEGRYAEAVIQLRNALQVDPRFAEAHYELAQAYGRLDDARNSLAAYARAADLMPERSDWQIETGKMLLATGRFEDARDRADKAVSRDGRSVEAHILRGAALAGMNDVETAIREIEEAIALDPKETRGYISLGTLQLYRERRKEAEAAFLRALEVDPTSINAHLAIANYYWATGRAPASEQHLQQALAIDGNHVDANRAIATFYIASNRALEAEPHLKKVAERSGDAAARLTLADYYLVTGRQAQAVAILDTVAAGNRTAFAGARARRAAIEYSTSADKAHATLDEALARNPADADMLTVKSRFLLNENKLDDALAHAQRAIVAQPQAANARYALGLVHMARNELNEAIAAFTEVARLNPRAAAAQLQLARAHLARGGAKEALTFADQAVRLQPRDPVARQLLARALMGVNETGRALTLLQEVVAEDPGSAAAQAQLGTLYVMRNDPSAARAAYERALRVDPDFLEAVAGLVQLDVAAKRVPEGRARIEAQLARTPNDVGMLLVAARAFAATGDLDRVETTLRRAIEIDVTALEAYGLLAQVYIRGGRMDAAKREFERLLQQQPKSVAAYTMIGMIEQAQGNTREAIRRYEAAVAVDPRAAPAANNLAWLYAEGGGSLDTALALAQTAKAQLPNQPEVNDTLAWIYYRKNLPALAIPLLRESIEREPGNAIYHYHLGLAYARTGDKARAREALNQALRLRPEFDGAAEARRVLRDVAS